LYSKALDRLVQIRVSTRVLRTIDKVGGLDEYLLGEKEARIRELGVSGWWLRWAIMQTPEVRRRFREQRVGFGVPENGLPDEEVATEEGEAQVQGTLDEGGKMRRLKFRVGPRAHLYYSGGRWRRAKPDKGRRFKDILRKSDRTYIEYRDELRRTTLENLEEVLRKLPKKQRLSETEQNTLRQKAMREVDKRAEKLVQNRWQAKALRDSRMNRKKLRKFLRKKRRMMTRAELRDARRRDSREKTGEALMKDAGVESGRMRDERE
jgi:large subunit ribosomal protein L28